MRAHEFEQLPRQLNIFTAVDLDRTVLRTTEFFEHYAIPNMRHYYWSRGEVGLVDRAIDQTRVAEHASRGKAFDFVGDFDQRLRTLGHEDMDIDELARQILDANRDLETGELLDDFITDIIADGGFELIQTLEAEPASAWGFMTSGGDLTQRLKLSIVATILRERFAIDVQGLIIASEHKAQDLESWYDESRQQFVIPTELSGGTTMYADELRLIDDKLKNLERGDAVRLHDRIELIQARRAEYETESEGEYLAAIAATISTRAIDNDMSA
ncbi:MAG TPA: hypothetical protein VL362_01835 [Patescibacteria group bacterium]|jgi:hypothetical protein|nr:hypothetical protein [Patescibacteria group bacterium]